MPIRASVRSSSFAAAVTPLLFAVVGCSFTSPGQESLADSPTTRALGVPDLHRPAPMKCSADRAPTGEAATAASAHRGCASDADCAAGWNGRCVGIGEFADPACSYDGCFADADCDVGQACACGVAPLVAGTREPHRCVAAQCHVDADCGAAGFCSPSRSYAPCVAGSTIVGLYCHTPHDACATDADCVGADGYSWSHCEYDVRVGRWACLHDGGCSG